MPVPPPPDRPRTTARQLLDQAPACLAQVQASPTLHKLPRRSYPTFDASELVSGPRLGQGGFGIVVEVAEIQLRLPTEISIHSPEDPWVHRESLSSEQPAEVVGVSEKTEKELAPTDHADATHVAAETGKADAPSKEDAATADDVESEHTDAAPAAPDTPPRPPTSNATLSSSLAGDVSPLAAKASTSLASMDPPKSRTRRSDGAPVMPSDDSAQYTARTVTTISFADPRHKTNGGSTTAAIVSDNSRASHQETHTLWQEDDCHYPLTTAREHMWRHVRRQGDARYAIKRLRRDLTDLEQARGRIDLAMEALFLSALGHPNIVKLRATASGDPTSPHFFIVLDRLYGTLNDKFDAWSVVEKEHASKGVRRWLDPVSSKKRQDDQRILQQLLVERLVVAYDLAAALWYMHENDLVYRDIRPENIGFDVRGDVKIFDFGLAKSLSADLKAKDPTNGWPLYGYNLTARTGSVPYMAPEVVECQPYDTQCDVFSLSILLWEILSLQTAFPGYSRRDYLHRVVRRHERLPLGRQWPPLTRVVVKEGWAHDPQQRPVMKRMAAMIRGDLKDLTSDPEVQNRTTHMRERSSHSYRIRRALAAGK